MRAEMSAESCNVLVIGAGMAGLAAARVLAERGLRVLVLEAQERVGGRLLSQRVEGGGVVELGAEFVHGRAEELWALIAEAGVETVERDGAILRERSPKTGLAEDQDLEDGDLFAPLDQLVEPGGEDVSFAQWLRGSRVPEQQRAALTGYVEGFNAADARRISAKALGVQQRAEEEIEGDRSWHVRGGYAQLTEFLAERVKRAGGEVRLGCEVKSIRWRAGGVEVSSTAGALAAPKCIITLPLGVLQGVNTTGGIVIEPEPQAIAAASRMAMGEAVRFTMVFREPWWERAPRFDPDKLRSLSFVFTPSRMPPVWWTPHPEVEPRPTLTGWVGGPRARELAGGSAEELGTRACAVLADVFGVNEADLRDQLIATHAHDWTVDRFSRGAYSYVPAGALDAPGAMTQPQANTLFFAGEHTDTTGHWGTVHAALRSGLRAAAQVLER
jgi:monoamine oxidase